MGYNISHPYRSAATSQGLRQTHTNRLLSEHKPSYYYSASRRLGQYNTKKSQSQGFNLDFLENRQKNKKRY